MSLQIIRRASPGFGIRCTLALGLTLVLASCIAPPQESIFPSTRLVKKDETSIELIKKTSDAPDRLSSTATVQVPSLKSTTNPIQASPVPTLQGEPISVNFENVRLAAVINTVFGDLLKVPFEIDSKVMQRDVSVTLRNPEALPPNQFYRLVVEVLQNYGINVVYSNNVFRIIEAAAQKPQSPRIVRSRSVGGAPGDLRPVFYYTPINTVNANNMMTWISMAFQDRVRPTSVPNSNGLLLLGNAEDISAAIDTIQTLDQPFMAGYQGIKINPAFWSAGRLAAQLVDVLGAEGYSIGIGPLQPFAIKLIPVEALNTIIAFGTSQEALQHLLQWATDLDQPSQTVGTMQVFYHQVYNAKAKDVLEVIKNILEGGSSAPPGAQDQKGGGGTITTRQRVTVDESHNALIFQGSAEEYAQFRTLLAQMDKAPLAVLIEATVAEVTLGKDMNIGTSLGFNDAASGANSSAVTVSSGGLTTTLVRNMGDLNLKLNALAHDKKVQILSSPRLVTNSGKSASINVGTQVPIITEQQQSPGTTGGTSNLLQSVQYRNTGVILTINPTINSSRRVEITLSQEVSQAQPNGTSSISSPTILQRQIQTTLSLDDGETVLLGGLITQNYSDDTSGVPFLKDIPGLGLLFNNRAKSVDRTELIVLLTPYIIDSPETSRQVRDAFRSQMGDWARLPPQPLKPMPPVEPLAAVSPVSTSQP